MSPSTNNSNLIWRLPAVLLGSSSRARSASMALLQKCFGFVGRKQVDTPRFYALGISFSCTISLLQRNPRMDLAHQFEYRIYKIYIEFGLLLYILNLNHLYWLRITIK